MKFGYMGKILWVDLSARDIREEIIPDDPHGYPYMAEEKTCIGCGFCARECPVDAVTMIFIPFNNHR